MRLAAAGLDPAITFECGKDAGSFEHVARRYWTHTRCPQAQITIGGQGRGRTADLPIRSQTRWSAPDAAQQCRVAAVLADRNAYQCRIFATIYQRNVGVE